MFNRKKKQGDRQSLIDGDTGGNATETNNYQSTEASPARTNDATVSYKASEPDSLQIHGYTDEKKLTKSNETKQSENDGTNRINNDGDKHSGKTSEGKADDLQTPSSDDRRHHASSYGTKLPHRLVNGLLSGCAVMAGVANTIVLPLYTNRLRQVGSSAYTALLYAGFFFAAFFFVCALLYKLICDRQMSLLPRSPWWLITLAGLLNGTGSVLMVYASDPTRTPSYLQPLLWTLSIPLTAFFRFLILRKGLSIPRLLCIFVLLVGLFISVEPQIWHLDGSSYKVEQGPALPDSTRILWTMCFALTFIPNALMNVIWEREMKNDEVSIVFLTWTHSAQFIALLGFFWTDFVPGFGTATSPADFCRRLVRGLECHFGGDLSCLDIAGFAWLDVITYCSGTICNILLVKYAEGAVYMVVVTALTTPIGALWWSLFRARPYLHWYPSFTVTTAFTLAGLCMMMPAVVCYDYLYEKDLQEQEEKQKTANEKNPVTSKQIHEGDEKTLAPQR